MAKAPSDAPGLGYSYHLPTSGLLLRVRNFLAQFSDLFSEFNKYIAPAYHHDRCERSVYMRLYSMNKREFVMVFLAFFACFGLAIFIGLAGPPITVKSEISASQIMARVSNVTNSDAYKSTSIANGPFVMKSQYMTTYNQQLWVIAKLETENNDDEFYDKSFKVNVAIDGLTQSHAAKTILHKNHMKNRTRHLKCWKNDCDEFIVLHLGFLEYSHYIVTVRFSGLESFQKRYHIKDLKFYFKTYNPAFTQIEIWFRFIFLFTSFVCTCWFGYQMRKYPLYDWSIEQKWIMILLPLLVLYDNPFFPLIFLMNSWFPGMLDAIFQASFLCALLLFWLCLYHSLRQTERKFLRFYLPKVLIVIQIWVCAIILATWEKCNELRDPTYSHFVDTENYQSVKSYFFISGSLFCVYLLFLMVKAYSELRSMPYFDMRLRFLTLLMLFVIGITVTVTVCRFGFGILEDNFVANLKTTYRSSAQFMCFYSLLNFYLYTMSYVYSPTHSTPTKANPITKDNPAFSMINDSDEDIVYDGSDEDRRPLNSSTGKGNDYDSD